ncbi:hypothetical protein A3A66_01460 [Microgenomates group bacterium RIFCSPLOWO2_01_FULL_46_13]|nr:MAG: hypothetical protein A2783_00945 [Microgenomates group bacterium RIFCSPHIGHO2_01_FULL_45_11]OGV94666.1 MAG: hypothetical protein A3A66_01460 [Microgenomates group bacterium RIFCSPLOWO2_01_FULL_46_13]
MYQEKFGGADEELLEKLESQCFFIFFMFVKIDPQTADSLLSGMRLKVPRDIITYYQQSPEKSREMLENGIAGARALEQIVPIDEHPMTEEEWNNFSQQAGLENFFYP